MKYLEVEIYTKEDNFSTTGTPVITYYYKMYKSMYEINVPDSKTFDVTLMILLLRNLTPITPPPCGFDRLPSATDTTAAADLARIKHYRNYLAHLDDGKLDTVLFNTAWNDITNVYFPDSKTFDATLMITLLRNLTPMTPPRFEFDHLPSAIETMTAADLTRIKHYRNYLAHLDDGKLDTGFFNTAWTDITSAIDRLGGQQMNQECDHLKTKPLDQTNQEIMMDIKHSNHEIQELKESLKSLKRSHTEMMKSYELLQEQQEEVKEIQ
ncbi:unnamed protein product [Mytilus coruscus]|uniref:DZIP3-like HEPN domain-containing protein n=1 Tax=Mytilus coruscus TaxID=42192 RepID=A0A6J8DX43_MYTCO|nr:unnamed protein product [Mytilus coruscus]